MNSNLEKGSNSDIIIQKETGKNNIIFFGDSISYGELVSPHNTWINKISALIEENYTNQFLIINSSINGNTTRMALERMPNDVQKYGVFLLIIQFGMNDCNYWQTDQGMPRVSPDVFRYNLKEIISRGRKFGAKKILIPTSHPTPLNKPFSYSLCSYEESRRLYSQIIRKVAADDNNVRLIDIEKDFEQKIIEGEKLQDYLMPDGIHLSLKGHEFYFSTFCPIILEELKNII